MSQIRRPVLLSLFISLSFLSLLFLFCNSPPIPLPTPTTASFSSSTENISLSSLSSPPPPPRIAYFIIGSSGDGSRILRLLYSIFHPRNYYLIHLDHKASMFQRAELALAVKSVKGFGVGENVNVIGKADVMNYEGSTPISVILHGVSILLRLNQDWDWFVNLDASDYPLISQDELHHLLIDFLHVMSFVPRDLNFIQHTSKTGWNEHQRIIQVTVDPGLYLGTRGKIFVGTNKRTIPKAFTFCTGSPHVILSRKLAEFSILGLDNFPRTLLLYFSNIKSSHKGYFQTLACNSNFFSSTVVNSNLHLVAWDNPPGKEPRNLRVSDLNKLLGSGFAFAGPFLLNDPVLNKIDSAVLNRKRGRISPGRWCWGETGFGRDPCIQWGDTSILRPGPGAERFEKHLLRLLENVTFHSRMCINYQNSVESLWALRFQHSNTLMEGTVPPRPDGTKKAYVRLTPDYDALDVANKIGII
ncbi:Glycosyl transferase, family 14 [Dillenia turbinata]|uniref:Glycosyl transferase, family 14 n=1 Tax=Dillenia turbinata TaxID=194707 RepID=A0AAN8VKG7_9MAGN